MNWKVQHATTHRAVTSVSAKMDISLYSHCINVKVRQMNIYSILAYIPWIKTKTFKSTDCIRLFRFNSEVYG